MREKREATERLGRNLRRARLRVGLSQEVLARRVGLSRAHVGRLEAGKTECRASTAMRLAEGLGIGIDDLLDGIVWTPDPGRTITKGRSG